MIQNRTSFITRAVTLIRSVAASISIAHAALSWLCNGRDASKLSLVQALRYHFGKLSHVLRHAPSKGNPDVTWGNENTRNGPEYTKRRQRKIASEAIGSSIGAGRRKRSWLAGRLTRIRLKFRLLLAKANDNAETWSWYLTSARSASSVLESVSVLQWRTFVRQRIVGRVEVPLTEWTGCKADDEITRELESAFVICGGTPTDADSRMKLSLACARPTSSIKRRVSRSRKCARCVRCDLQRAVTRVCALARANKIYPN